MAAFFPNTAGLGFNLVARLRPNRGILELARVVHPALKRVDFKTQKITSKNNVLVTVYKADTLYPQIDAEFARAQAAGILDVISVVAF